MNLHPNAQRPRVGGPGRRWVLAWGMAIAILGAFAIYSATSITHGFVAYYAAARLLSDGALGPAAYDDGWFGAYVQQLTGSNIREIFTPNPPTMALMAWPLAPFDHATARAIWLIVSVAAFAAAVYALAKDREQRDGMVPTPQLLLALLAPAVFSNIRIAQGYLIVFALFAAAVLSLSHRRDTRGGAALGLVLGLKLSGTAMLLVLAAQRRWRAIAVAAAMAIALVAVVTPFIDASMWWQHPDTVRAFVQRPSGSVTAYQTTLSLFRRLCVIDPIWNPTPAASCEAIAFAMPYTLLAVAAGMTTVAAHRSQDPRLAAVAGTVLSLLLLPASAEVHFVLLGIPLLLMPLRPWQLAIVAALLIVPLEVTAERFTSGWQVLLAYPRLYASWVLWAVCVKELLRNKGSVSL